MKLVTPSHTPLLSLCLVLMLSSLSGQAVAQEGGGLDRATMVGMLQEIDNRQQSVGDYKALVFIDQKRKDKAELVYEAAVYRRDAQNKLVLMFLKPKSEAGKGYLQLDRNLFLYDPSVGKWERRTDREGIGGTDSQRRDFDAASFSKDYTPSYVGLEKLGKFSVHHMKLTAKKGRKVAYPTLQVWVDQASGNPLKVQEFALSGKLMRTAYYPKWAKVQSADKGSPVYFPKEIRIFDEVEKQNSTTVITRKVELSTLPGNIFTKAWVESKSR